MTRRAGLYDRLSLAKLTDTATDDAQSRQQERSRAFATAKGWEVVEVFSDVDRSAYRAPGQKAPPKREQFERALAAIEAGEIDALVFFKLDRLCRDHGDFERVLATCERHGAVLASVMEPIDTSTPAGEMSARMLVGFARLESQTIGLRVAAQREQAASRGLPAPGGWRPFGYREGGLEVDEGEAEVIKEAASRVLAGETLNSIARDLGGRPGDPERPGARPWRSSAALAARRPGGLRTVQSAHAHQVGARPRRVCVRPNEARLQGLWPGLGRWAPPRADGVEDDRGSGLAPPRRRPARAGRHWQRRRRAGRAARGRRAAPAPARDPVRAPQAQRARVAGDQGGADPSHRDRPQAARATPGTPPRGRRRLRVDPGSVAQVDRGAEARRAAGAVPPDLGGTGHAAGPRAGPRSGCPALWPGLEGVAARARLPLAGDLAQLPSNQASPARLVVFVSEQGLDEGGNHPGAVECLVPPGGGLKRILRLVADVEGGPDRTQQLAAYGIEQRHRASFRGGDRAGPEP